MQEQLLKNEEKAYRKSVWVIRTVFFLAGLMIAGGGIWYIAVTGIVGRKEWDFMKYGLPAAILSAAGAVILIAAVIGYFRLPCFQYKAAPLLRDLKRTKGKYLMILPGLIFVFVFSYMPMYGVILAFKDYKIKSGILYSAWCGLENFSRFFTRDVAWDVIGNTLFIGVTQLLITFPVPIILALLLNELKHKKFKKAVQSVIYLPHFVSWIIMYSLMFSLFSITGGAVNKLLISMGGTPMNILSDPDSFYGMLYGTSIWKEAGWGTIIYMAAISGVDMELYEASRIDGANRFQQCLYITLPCIAFSITTMLILNVGSIMGSNFDQIMNLRTDATSTTVAQVIDTYIYDMGVTKGEYDLSTAIGLFQQAVNCILVFGSNYIVKKMSGEGFF